MSLKSYKPYTKSTRATVLVDRKSIWKGSPFKSLTKGKTSSGGRNNLGRITSRARGAGHKKGIELLTFTEIKLTWQEVLKELNMIQTDLRSLH